MNPPPQTFHKSKVEYSEKSSFFASIRVIRGLPSFIYRAKLAKNLCLLRKFEPLVTR